MICYRLVQIIMRAPFSRVLSFFFLLFLCSAPLSGETLVDRDVFVARFIEMAEIIQAENASVSAAEADYDRAFSQHFPKIKFMAGTGPHPRYEYNYDINEWEKTEKLDEASQWGIAVRVKGSFVVPAYTFGKISHAKEAALKGIEVALANREITRLALQKEASKFYYTYIYARELKTLLEMAREKVNEAEGKLKKWLYEEKDGVTQKDLIKLRIEKENFAWQYDKVENSLKTLNDLFDALFQDGWQVKESYLEKSEFDSNLKVLLDYQLTKSPYARYITSGVEAYRNLYEMEKSYLFPDIGFGGELEYKYTSSVENDSEQLPQSPYNGTDGEIGVALSLSLNYFEQWAKVKKAKARWNNARFNALFAKRAAQLKLNQMVRDLSSLSSQIRHVRKARKLAKGWMTMEMANFESGFGKTKDLIDSITKFGEYELKLIQALYEYNLKVDDIVYNSGME